MSGGMAECGSVAGSENTGTPFSLRVIFPPLAAASRSRSSMNSRGYQCACVSIICMQRGWWMVEVDRE